MEHSLELKLALAMKPLTSYYMLDGAWVEDNLYRSLSPAFAPAVNYVRASEQSADILVQFREVSEMNYEGEEKNTPDAVKAMSRKVLDGLEVEEGELALEITEIKKDLLFKLTISLA